MGCGASQDENPNEIKSDFKYIGIADLDSIFDKAAEVFGAAEDMRSGL